MAPGRSDGDRRLIAIVDDDEGARVSTESLLGIEGYCTCPFADGESFLASPLLGRTSCVLLDIRMPGLSGLDVLRALAGRDDSPEAVMLTGHGDIPLAVAAMRLGAADFIEKPYQPAALLGAVAEASAKREVERVSSARRGEARALVEALPGHQRRVLTGIAGGRPNKIIARELGLSVRTVEGYRAQLFERLGVRSIAELIRIALLADAAA